MELEEFQIRLIQFYDSEDVKLFTKMMKIFTINIGDQINEYAAVPGKRETVDKKLKALADLILKIDDKIEEIDS